MSLLKTLGIAVACGGLFLWLLHALPPLPRGQSLAELPEEALVAAPLPATEDGPATIEGIAIYDAEVDPPVPYVQYELAPGQTRTKQLIYESSRGCSTHAGDLPCALGPEYPAPEVPYGARMRVTGTIVGDQILVDTVEIL